MFLGLSPFSTNDAFAEEVSSKQATYSRIKLRYIGTNLETSMSVSYASMDGRVDRVDRLLVALLFEYLCAIGSTSTSSSSMACSTSMIARHSA